MELKIVKNTNEAVLIEVIFSDAIDMMSNKGFIGKEKHIKLTKGKHHTITVYDKDNIGYINFGFGESGYTLISDDLNVLKNKVYDFVLSQHIQPKNMKDETETNLKIMIPKEGFGKEDQYCVHLGGEIAKFFHTEQGIKKFFGEYEVYNQYVAYTGVTVLQAKLITTKEKAELLTI